MHWRDYIRQDNPVAAALLSQMGYNKEERVQVKNEFLRMLIRLEIDPARLQLITGFFEQYLTLSDQEEYKLKKEIEQLDEQEADTIFKIETSWEKRGRIEGKIEVAKCLLSKGMSIENVMNITELSREEIEK